MALISAATGITSYTRVGACSITWKNAISVV